jgi:mannosyltransferase OCH1-like enzyme
MGMIPKNIITIWLSEKETPDIVNRCVDSHYDIKGYEHKFITLDNVYRGSIYVNECLVRKDWVRACDYLRLYYLNLYGGIYLDADVEIKKGCNFDHLLNSQMFVFKEESGYLNNGYIGSTKDHPFLKYVLNTMENNFRFEQNLFYPGMQFFCEAYFIADRNALDMKIYDLSELKKVAHHYGLKSWVK